LLEYLVTNAYSLNATLAAKLDGSRILITGASGLVGLNIIATLVQLKRLGKKISIVCVVGSYRTKLINQLEKYNIHVECLNLADINIQLDLGKFDIIINAAGYGQPNRFLNDKLNTLSLNSITLLKLSKCLNVGGRFLAFSSSEIYSGNSSFINTEMDIGTTNPQHPRACYIEGKRLAETICEILREAGVSAYSIRLALAYGPGVWMDDQRVLNQFVKSALSHGKIELLDQGQAIRTYCYICDVIDMVFNVLLSGSYSVYNVGGKSRMKIIDLAHEIAGQLGVPYYIPKSDNSIVGAPSGVGLDLSRYESEFNKDDYVPISEGISKTIDWYKFLIRNEN